MIDLHASFEHACNYACRGNVCLSRTRPLGLSGPIPVTGMSVRISQSCDLRLGRLWNDAR